MVTMTCRRAFLKSPTKCRQVPRDLVTQHFGGRFTVADQIIVATFNNTNAAYDAATALKGLKDKGVVDFKPKAGVMVKKDDKGNLSLLETKDRPLWGTGIGT